MLVERDGRKRRTAGRDRRHERTARERALFVRYSHAEYEIVAEAARLSGLTPTGFAADAALAAARGLEAPVLAPLRAILRELILARGQLRRLGTNVNQAVRELNSTGAAPVWLQRSVALASAAIERIDTAACQVSRHL